jgi:hypothetical protein
MPRIRSPTVFYPRPLPAAPQVYPVPAKYVSFNPGVSNKQKYGDGVRLPELYMATAEDPQMGFGMYTKRAAYPGSYLLLYGVEITHARAKWLSRKV